MPGGGGGADTAGHPGESRYAKRQRIREHLLDLVERRTPGEPMPPERTLAEDLGVSRPTLRAVVEDLVRDGLLDRRHGKGAIVAPPKVAQQLPGAVDGVWTSRILAFAAAEPAGLRIGRRLRTASDDPVVRITRLRFVDDAPVCIERLYVPADVVPGLRAEDLSGRSFHGILIGDYGIEPATASQTIEPTVLDVDEAALLEVPVHAPALLFERLTRAADGRIVEFSRSVYRGDRYAIHCEFVLSARDTTVRVTRSSWNATTVGADQSAR